MPNASAAAAPAATLPSREELVMAWGDQVLPALRPAVKVFVAMGRFMSVGQSAVLALPDKGLLSRAQPFKAEVEDALARHFGRTVPVELVLDDGSNAAPAAGRRADLDDHEDINIGELEDAPAGVASPEQRLLEAFPGAEEVSP